MNRLLTAAALVALVGLAALAGSLLSTNWSIPSVAAGYDTARHKSALARDQE
jgi:hypothetical protein